MNLIVELTQDEQQVKRRQLEAARDRALKHLNELVKVQREAIWKSHWEALDQLGLDKQGRPKKVQ